MDIVGRIKEFLGPRPSLTILNVNQGIVEIIVRGVLIALIFFTFIPGAVLHSHLKYNSALPPPADILDAIAVTKTGAQWIIVVCLVAMFGQALAIALRFLNLVVIENYIGFVLIMAIVIRLLFIISWFAGVIFFAVRSTDWLKLGGKYETNLKNDSFVSFSTIASSSAGTSTICFFTLIGDILLTVWLVMWLLLRWQQLITQQLRYQPGPFLPDKDAEDWALGDD